MSTDTDSLFSSVPKKVVVPVPDETEDGVKVPMSKAERTAYERDKLEARLASGDLDDTRTRVAYILNQYPDTRNSDIELSIRYWEEFERHALNYDSISFDALFRVTRITSIARARAKIQNEFGLFVSDDQIAERREELAGETRKSQVARRNSRFVQVYCDESGKSDKNYIVGSVWINDTESQSLKLYGKLNEWRKENGLTEEIHFVEMSSGKAEKYLQFFGVAMEESQYIGFKER
jgi:hypothetical protein